MVEILKRALDEALTAVYAGEIPPGAEEVAFSEEFEREMRGLIRRTDRPIQKYIPLLTAAACAVIAIGCAVLLPRLLSHSIPVEPGENSTATVTSAAPTDEPAESSSPAETTPDEPGFIPPAPYDDWNENPNRGLDPDEIADENPGAFGIASEEVADHEEDTTTWDDDVTGENGVPGATDPSPETDEPTAAETTDRAEAAANDEEDTIVDDGVDDEDDDSGNIVIDDSDDEIRDTNPGAVSSDSDNDSDDDDVGYDSEDDMDFDNDEESNESGLPPIARRATLNGEVKALLGCSLADSYLHNGNLLADGKFYDVPIVEGIDPETYRDPELAERIGAAKLIDGEPEERGLPLFWGNVGKEAPVIKPVYESDQSDRNHYDEIYFEGERSIEDEDVEDMDDSETLHLEFLRNGIVCVFRDGYSGSVYYQLDDETLETLTARIEARFDVSKPKTVGDLMKQLGSAEDYARVYVSVTDYYDCTLSGALSDGSFLADLLQKYKKEKLREGDNSGAAAIRIKLTSRKLLRAEDFVFYADGTVRVGGDRYFRIDEADVRAILTEYCRQKNLPAPVFYETLGEYLPGKNFTTLSHAWLYGTDMSGDLALAGDDAEIRALIEKYAAESTLLPGGKGASIQERGSIAIQVEGWFYTVRINRSEIRIGGTRNIFRTPDGLYEKLCAVLSEKGESPHAGQDEDYWDDDVAEEVTDD